MRDTIYTLLCATAALLVKVGFRIKYKRWPEIVKQEIIW